MSVEFWLTICATFIGIALSLLMFITKKEKTGAKIAIIISFIIAICAFIMGISKNYSENGSDEKYNTTNKNETVSNKTYSENIINSNMFTNYFETHETNTNQVNFYLKKWNSYEDKDIKALSHTDENGIKVLANSTFLAEKEDASVDIHLTYNSEYKGNPIMSGKIVTMKETSSSKSCATVSILKDNVEVWKSNKTIRGQTVEPIEFEVDTKDCKNEIIIRFNYYIQKDSLNIAIFE